MEYIAASSCVNPPKKKIIVVSAIEFVGTNKGEEALAKGVRETQSTHEEKDFI